jgi:hypothetical protein
MSTCRLIFAKGPNRLELEGEQAFVQQQLDALLPLIVEEQEDSGDAPSPTSNATSPPGESTQDEERQSLRSFVAAKAPKNSYDSIACVLFFARSVLGKAELSPDEIRAFLLQAKQRPPGALTQALADAKRRYGFVEPGARKGYWRLGHAGEVRVELELPGGGES